MPLITVIHQAHLGAVYYQMASTIFFLDFRRLRTLAWTMLDVSKNKETCVFGFTSSGGAYKDHTN